MSYIPWAIREGYACFDGGRDPDEGKPHIINEAFWSANIDGYYLEFYDDKDLKQAIIDVAKEIFVVKNMVDRLTAALRILKKVRDVDSTAQHS